MTGLPQAPDRLRALLPLRMRWLSLLSILLLWLGAPRAHGQSVSVLEWDYGTTTSSANASVKHSAVASSTVNLQATTGISGFSGALAGTSPSFYYGAGAWNGTATASLASATTATVQSGVKQVYANFTMKAPATGDWSAMKVTFSYAKSGTTAVPTTMAAYLSWSGGTRYGTATVSGATTTFANGTITLNTGSAAPAATALAGTNFLLVLHCYGGSGGTLLIDNVKFQVNSLSNTDYSDFSTFTAVSSLTNSSLKLGATTDAELTATTNTTATGDDTTNTGSADDEDGVTLPALTLGAAANVPVVLTNNTGANAYLKGWIDYNGNGSLTDSGELVINDTIPTGTVSATRTYRITPTASGTNRGVRFRLSSDTNVTPVSSGDTGEIEDYLATINTVAAGTWYEWTMNNANEDWTVDPTTELSPTVSSWTPNINGESFGHVSWMRMSYNPNTKELRGEIRLKAYSPTIPWQGFWLALSEGPLPRTQDRAILYYDGTTPAQPKMTMYVYDTTQNQNSWSNPGKMLSSSITGTDLKPGPMISEGGDYYRVQWYANLSTINNSANYASYSLPADWKGMQFGSEVGVWLHFFKFATPPTYDGAGKLTSFNVDEVTTWTTGYKQYIGWFDTGTPPAVLNAATTAKSQDFGDWLGNGAGTWATSSTVNANLKLGTATVDADTTLTVNAAASGDDTTSTDDEDAMTMPASITAGNSATFTIPSLLNNTGSGAYLNAWIDFNADGLFDNALVTAGGERLGTEIVVGTSASTQSKSFTFTVPPTAVNQSQAGVRFRLTSISNPGSTGDDGNGEVEDHVVNLIGAVDYGDWNGTGAATTTVTSAINSNLRLGATVDAETSVIPNATATADGADEDGVTMPASITVGMSGSIPVTVFNNTGANAYLTAWIDFDGNGTFADPSERITSQTIASSATARTLNVGFITPATATAGTQRGVRFRLNSTAAATPTSTGTTGEIEDYVTNIVAFTAGGVAAGNLVWKDTNGDGGFQPNGVDTIAGNADDEVGIAGVTVQILDNTTSALVMTVATNATGNWIAGPLTSGTAYKAFMPATNFQAGGPLYGLTPKGSPTSVAQVDDATVAKDNTLPTITPTTIGSTSYPFTIAATSAPNNTIELGNNGTMDDTVPGDTNGNMTIDFAMCPATCSIGNLVWNDLNNNGLFDSATETGIPSVQLELYDSFNNYFGTTTTNATGRYRFTGLAPNTYYVRLAIANFGTGGPLRKFVSSTTNDVGTTVDDNDNGANSVATTGKVSNNVTLAYTGQPVNGGTETGTGNTDDDTDGDAAGNMTIDFGMLLEPAGACTATLTNSGFETNNMILSVSAATNATPIAITTTANHLYATGASVTISGVLGNTAANGTFTITATGATTFTLNSSVGNGTYTSGGTVLPNGAANWPGTAGTTSVDLPKGTGPINSWLYPTRSTGTGTAPKLVKTPSAITFPGGQSSGSYMVYMPPGPDIVGICSSGSVVNTNNTYQIAVWAAAFNPASPSNSSAEFRIEFEALSASNNASDSATDPVTTMGYSSGGTMVSHNLNSGTGSAINGVKWTLPSCVPLATDGSVWATGKALDYTSLNWQLCWVQVKPNYQGLFVLLGQTQTPTAGGVLFDSATMECVTGGTYTKYLSLGNLVYNDANSNGLYDSGEGVSNTKLQLYNSSNILLGRTCTDASGRYMFSGLPIGTYYVKVPSTEFQSGAPLFGKTSSTPVTPSSITIDDGTAANDNGIDNATPATNGVQSNNIVVTATGAQPDAAAGETGFDKDADGSGADSENNTNLTIDFGFSVPGTLAIGNLVWNDANNNGIKDVSEVGINGVTMELLKDANGNGIIDVTELTPLATTVTATVSTVVGTYAFTALTPGKYVVQVAGSNFALSGSLGTLRLSSTVTVNTDNQTDNDDNGYQAFSSWSVASPVITLTAGGEPTSGTTDNTVDFGFTTPAPRCKFAYICGTDKPQNGFAFDHGLIKYIEATLGPGSVTALLSKTSGSTLALYDPWAPNTELSITLTDYDAILVSPTCYTLIAPSLTAALRDVARPVLSLTANPNAVDMKMFSSPSLHWSNSAWNGTADIQLTDYLTSNPTSNYNPVFESGSYYPEGVGLLWSDAANQATLTQGVYVYYPAGSLSARGAAATHGMRVFFGISLNGVQENWSNSGQPFTEAEWLDPLIDWTPAGKSYFDRALGAVSGPCFSDFGDNPSFASASQVVSTELRIGTNATDSEAANPTTGSATADDTTGSDDEDLTLPSFTLGTATNLVIPVTLPNAAFLVDTTARLNVFVDWNGNNIMDAGETMTAQTVAGSGNYTFSLTPPTGSTGTRYLRIRLTEGSTTPAFSGASGFKGEVEDYAVSVLPNTDLGDWNGSGALTGSASSIISPNLRLGQTVDGEASVTPDAAASADGADEDGVNIPTSVRPGASVTIPVSVFNNNTSGKYLQAWIDFNNDGTFNNTDVTSGGERIYNSVTPANASQQFINVTFTVPAAASLGNQRGVRFRLSDNSATTPTSSGATGEIEDYVVAVAACPPSLIEYDFNSGHYNVAVSPSFRDPSLTGGVFQLFSLTGLPLVTDDPPEVNGPTKGGFGIDSNPSSMALKSTLRCAQGFDGALNAAMQTRPRSSLTAITSKTWSQFTVASNVGTGSITGVTLDIARQGSNAPSTVQGYLTWFDGVTYRTAWTAPFTLANIYFNPSNNGTKITTGNAAWQSINLGAFTGGGDTLPSGTGIAGKTFLFELYLYGDSGSLTDTIELDNLALNGTCTGQGQDYGDWNGGGAATATAYSIVNASLRLGATVDAETSVTPDVNATADGADEDGVTMPAAIVAAQTSLSIPVSVFNNTGSNAYLDAWIDFNADGAFNNTVATTGGTGERSKTQLTIASSASAQPVNVVFDVPSGASVGNLRGVRFRLTNNASQTPTSSGDTGEIEDYVVGINSGPSIGNRVWIDTNGNGTFEFASGELPLDGVKMNLYRDVDANGTLGGGDGSPIATQFTSNGGYYRFNGLSAGDYIVEVAASNFTSGAILENFVTTSGSTDPDNNIDNDDNGASVAGFGVASSAINLSVGGEPTTDGDTDASSNLTVDFGFSCPGSLGWESYVSNNQRDTVTRHAWSSGAYIADLFSTGTGGLQRPYDIALGPNGDLFVTSSFGATKIVRYNGRTGALIGTFISDATLNTPSGITWGPDGNCYIASRNSNEIKRYNGTTGAFIDNFITTGLNQPFQGLLWSTDNKLYVGNYGSGLIKRYDVNGVFLDSIALPGGVLTVRGFTFGPDGNLYVCAHNNIVYKVTTGATMAISTFATSSGAFGGINFGPDGNLYVSDIMNHNIRKINGSTGADIGVWSSGGTLGEPKEAIFLPRCFMNDYGDWNGSGALTTATTSTVSSNVRLGATVDTEFSVTPDVAATADGADEDGVTMPATITQGQNVTIPVTLFNSNTGGKYLQAWIDFDGNGTFADPGERIYNAVTAASATLQSVSVTFTVPVGASVGTQRGARFRLSDNSATTPTSSGAVGEIEDYVVNIASCTVVTSTADSGVGTLRDAILCANARPGLDTITFAIAGAGVKTITLASALPDITDPVLIDGYTQPSSAANTLSIGDNATLLIEVNGATFGGFHFVTGSTGSTLRGLVINRCDSAVWVQAPNCTITGNFIGTNALGTVALPNNKGISVQGVSGALIGGTATSARNVISGNTLHGIELVSSATGNSIQGNYIGLNAAGTAALPNTGRGIDMTSSSNTNAVGGIAVGAGNVVSGNGMDGIRIQTTGNTILGNYVGLNGAGTAAIGNAYSGIELQNGSNVVGGSVAGSANVVSGNAASGITIVGGSSNSVKGNLVGTNAAGTALLGNVGFGVQVSSATNSVGGTVAGEGNTIAGNGGGGIYVSGTSAQAVSLIRNSIYDNTGLGIDIGTVIGLSPNDGAVGASQSNNGIDYPIFTSVSLSGTNLTVAGIVGNNYAGSGTFASATVEVFAADNTPTDQSGPVTTSDSQAIPHGEGRLYLGTLTADSLGKFSGTLSLTAGQISAWTTLLGSAPSSASPVTGTASDAAGNTSEFGVVGPPLSIGNLVWSDTNNDGIKNGAESGLSGATVQLFLTTNATIGDGDDLQIGSNIVTDGTGLYSFINLLARNYYVKVTPPAGTSLTSGTPAITDNDVDGNNDGAQPGGAGTALFSPIIALSYNSESITDGDTDANSNATVDFGLFTGFTVGDTVFNDINNNGIKDAGDSGISGLTVELLNGAGASLIPAVTTNTNASGNYAFLVYTPGTYRVKVTPSASYPLASSSAGTDNATDNNNDGVQSPSYVGSASTSFAFNLTGGGEPGTAGTTNVENTIDFGFRACPTINVAGTLPAGTQDTSYGTQTLTASGGSGAYTWTIQSGTLPTGLTLNGAVTATTATITGTPTVVQSSTFTIRATDALGCYKDTSYTVAIGCPVITITPATLGAFTQYSTISSVTMAASGGRSPYTNWTATGLPAGLSLSTGGALIGTPTAAPGSYSVTINTTDNSGCPGSRGFTIVIACPSVSVANNTLPNGTVGVAYPSTNFSASTAGTGVPAQTYTWTVSPALPTGMTLTSAGVLSGTPTIASASTTYTFTATNQTACAGSVNIAFSTVCPTVTVTPTTLAQGTVGTAYSQSLTASGGTSAYTWTTVSGTWPAGLSLGGAGVVSGTPSAATTGTTGSAIVVKATDANGCVSANTTVNIKVCPVLAVAPASMPTAVVGTAYSQAITASNGTAPYTYAVTSGALPAWATLTSGTISGTPNTTTSATFTITATDANGCTGVSASYTIAPSCPTISVSPATLSVGTVGSTYNQAVAFSASGGTGPFTFSATGLPTGISFDAVNAKITGSPVFADVYTIAVTATDSNGCSATQNVSFATCPAVNITPTSVSNGTIGLSYSQQMSARQSGFDVQQAFSSGTVTSLANADAVLAGTGRLSNWVGAASNVNFLSGGAPDGNFTGTAFPAGAGNNFALRATGVITIPTAGNWTFGTNSDDGVRLKIDGSAVITDDTSHANADKFGTVNLSAGTHTIDLVFFEAAGGEAVELFAQAGSFSTWNTNFKLIGGSGGLAVVRSAPTYTWSITSGSLPAGLSLNTSTGLISGTPTGAGGVSNFILKALDADGCFGTQALSITTACPTITLSPASLPTATAGTAYAPTISASGGNGTYTYDLTSGTLPAGLVFNTATGAITGTPSTANGAGVPLTFGVTDGAGCTASISYTLKVCPVLSISPVGPFTGTVGAAFNQTLTATNGVAPYTWSVTSGLLPVGLNLSSAGVISGVATTTATNVPVTIRATDANGCTGTRAYVLNAICPAVGITTGATLAQGTVGTLYSVSLTPTGGSSPYAFNLNTGTLPAGLTLSIGGIISGTPTAPTSGATGNSINVRVTDQYGCTGTKNFTIKTCPVITLSGSPPTGTTGAAYSTTFTASGSTATPYTFAVTAGTLPAGLSLSSAGDLTGTPSVSGSPTVTITATDTNGCTGSSPFTIPIGCPAITVTPTTAVTGTVGTAYSQALSASGGTGPYTWNTLSGTWPTGLSMDATGLISGTPTAPTTGLTGSSVTVRALDSNGCAASVAIGIKICPVITINPATVAAGTVGSAYAQSLTQTGGATPVSWSIITGTLPSGLGLNGVTGLISGTPSVANGAGANITAQVTDANGCVQTRAYTLKICPVLSITPATLADGTVGSLYSQTLTASNGTGPYSYAVTVGTLPAGLTLSGAVISGTPTTSNGSGTSITITATDANLCSSSKVYTLKICPTMSITPASMPAATVGTLYAQTVNATGGASPYTYTITSGTLPAWVTLNASTGVLTGTPNNTASATFTVTATDANFCTWPRTYTITPTCPTITVTPNTLAFGTVGSAYTQATAFSASGLTSGYNWTASGVPAGMTFDATNKILTGTPTTAGLYGIVVTATDSTYTSCSGNVTISFRVCPVITLTNTMTAATVGTAYSRTITSTGGTSGYTYSVTSGALPAGLNLSSGGVVSGTPTSNVTANFTITSIDANGCPGVQTYTMTPTCPTITVTPTTLAAATVGSTYVQGAGFSATGLSGNYTWSATGVPAGMTFNSGSRKLIGAPTTAGLNTLVVTATDNTYGTCAGSVTMSFRVCPVLSFASLTATGTVGTAYSSSAAASNGTAPYAYSVSAGSLPTGLSLNTSTGAVTGTPTTAGAYNFTISANDANTCPGSQAYTVTITCPTITVTPNTIAFATVGSAYSQSTAFSATGLTGNYNWSASGLPTGITLDTTNKKLIGTPNAGTQGLYNVTITATDSTYASCAGSVAISLRVCPVLTITPATLTAGVVGTAYSQATAFSVSGGTAPYTFAAPTGIPAGLSWDSVNLKLTGTPTATASTSIVLNVTDVNGCPGTLTVPFTVACPTINIAGSLPSTATQDAAYGTQTLTASGGTVPYSWTVVSGALPTGMTLNNAVTSTTATVTGTPTVVQSSTFTIRTSDNYGCVKDTVYSIAVGCPVITITPATIGSFTQYAAITNVTFGATGGRSPYTWSATGLPTGLALSSGGVLTGTPTAAPGSYSVTVNLTDNSGCPGSAGYTVVINCPTVTIGTASLPNGVVSTAYTSTTLTASTAGTGVPAQTYTWSVSPDLPAGLTLSSAGVLSGTPTVATASTNYTFTATNQQSCPGTKVLSLSTTCPTIAVSPSTLAFATVGSAYTQATVFSATGLTGTYVWSASGLPSGMSFDAVNKKLTGTPAAGSQGLYNVTVTATDSTYATCSGNVVISFRVCPVLSFAAITNTATIGLAYSSSATASNGTAPYAYSLSAGTLPAGLSLNASTGAITGTPITGGTYNFTIAATDGNLCPGSQAYTITVTCPTITLTPATLANATVGSSYVQATAFSASSVGSSSFTWTASNVPAGMSFDAVNKKLTGTPTNAGTGNVTITATDAYNCVGTVVIPFTRVCPGVIITQATLPDGDLSVGYSQTLTTSGGTAPYTYSITSGTLPQGLSLSSSGLLSGTTSAAATVNISVQSLDSLGCTASRSYSFKIVCPVPGFGYGINTTATLTTPVGIYETEFATGNARFMTALASGFTSGNALAFAETRGAKGAVIYGNDTDAKLAVWDRATGMQNVAGDLNLVTGGAVTGPIRSGAWHNGFYYFIAQNSDDLWKVNIVGTAGSYVVSSGTKVADLWSNTRAHNFGDIVINGNGTLYAIGLRQPGNVKEFFSADLTIATPVATQLGTPVNAYNGLAFGTDGKLYGGLDNAGPVHNFYEISTSDGSIANTVATNKAANLADLTRGACTPAPLCSVGNLVFDDINNNGIKDGAEGGLAGATVDLYKTTNTVVGDGDDVFVATLTTPATGAYQFGSLLPGKYFVKVTPPATHQLSSGTAVTLDNQVDNDNNGTQASLGAPAFSSAMDLSLTGEPITDGDADSGSDWTVDFGFWTGFTVGDLVWNDANGNGINDTETGVSGLAVALMTRGVNSIAYDGDDVQVTTTTTNGSGNFGFQVYTSGTYYFKVTPNTTYPVIGLNRISTDTGIDNDNNAFSQPGLINTAINGSTFALAPATEAGSAGSTNIENTIDIAVRACQTITVSPTTLANATVGVAYSQAVAFSSTGGLGSMTYSASGVPAGMSFDAVNRNLTGTPTTAGTSNVTITATDSYGCAGSVVIAFTRDCPTITVTPASLPFATVGSAYTQGTAFTASSAGNTSFTWSASGVPAGMSFNAATQKLTGTPTTPGAFTVNITATDANNCSGTVGVSMRVCPVLSITPTTIPNANVGLAYAQGTAFTASNGTAPYTYSVTGLPAGLSFDAVNAKIIGTPTTLGIATQVIPLTVNVVDADGCPGSLNIDLTVLPAMSVGNTVWLDTNDNGLKDSGEPGVAGVTMQLWTVGPNGVEGQRHR